MVMSFGAGRIVVCRERPERFLMTVGFARLPGYMSTRIEVVLRRTHIADARMDGSQYLLHKCSVLSDRIVYIG